MESKDEMIPLGFPTPPLYLTIRLIALLAIVAFSTIVVVLSVQQSPGISLAEYSWQRRQSHPPTPDIGDEGLVKHRLEYLQSPQWRAFQSGQRLAVIVPYRNRPEDLREFLAVLPGFLSAQGVDFEIYVVEQQQQYRFNRGMLLNAGFALSRQHFDPTYIALHDVDMLPAHPTVDYGFTGSVRSLASCVEQFLWDLPYPRYLGGVVLANAQTFAQTNGFSNRFWGWGGEDDDFSNRCHQHSVFVHHPRPHCLNQLRNTHAKHSVRVADPNAVSKANRVFPKRHLHVDGLSTLKYQVSNHTFDPTLRTRHFQVVLDVATWVESAHELSLDDN